MPFKATLAREKQWLRYVTKKNEVSAKLQTDSTASKGSSEAASSKAEHNAISRARHAANPKRNKVGSKLRYATSHKATKPAKAAVRRSMPQTQSQPRLQHCKGMSQTLNQPRLL